MDPVSNPYAPGAGTMPPELVGRDTLISDFRVALSRIASGRHAKSLMPVGLRGVGKTVLLNRFAEEAISARCLVASVETNPNQSLLPTLAARTRTILTRLDSGKAAKDLVQRAIRVLRSFTLRFSLENPANVEIGIAPEHGTADSGELPLDLTDLLVAVGQAAHAAKIGVLITIDEAQYLQVPEMTALITAFHKIAQLDLPIVLVATGLPRLLAVVGSARSYAERLFDFPEIGALSALETRSAMETPALKLGVTFEEEALEAIYETTKGYPFFVQTWAKYAWDRGEQSHIRLQDVISVTGDATDFLDRGFFNVRFFRITPRQKCYIRAMAELGPGPHSPHEVTKILGAQPASAASLRRDLIKKGMLYSPHYGQIAFTVPLFDEFIKRKMSFQALGSE